MRVSAGESPADRLVSQFCGAQQNHNGEEKMNTEKNTQDKANAARELNNNRWIQLCHELNVMTSTFEHPASDVSLRYKVMPSNDDATKGQIIGIMFELGNLNYIQIYSEFVGGYGHFIKQGQKQVLRLTSNYSDAFNNKLRLGWDREIVELAKHLENHIGRLYAEILKNDGQRAINAANRVVAENNQAEWETAIKKKFNSATKYTSYPAFIVGKMQIDRDGKDGSSIKVGKLTYEQLTAIDLIVNG